MMARIPWVFLNPHVSPNWFAAFNSAPVEYNLADETLTFEHCSLLSTSGSYIRLTRSCHSSSPPSRSDCHSSWRLLDSSSQPGQVDSVELPLPPLSCEQLLRVQDSLAALEVATSAYEARRPTPRNTVRLDSGGYCELQNEMGNRIILNKENAVLTCGRWTRAVWNLHVVGEETCDDLRAKIDIDLLCALAQDDYQKVEVVDKPSGSTVVSLQGGLFSELKLVRKRQTWKFHSLICDHGDYNGFGSLKSKAARAAIKDRLLLFNRRFDSPLVTARAEDAQFYRFVKQREKFNRLRFDQGSGFSLTQLCHLAEQRQSSSCCLPRIRGAETVGCALM